ncbi:hypothetical protein ACSQ67_025896 [Phaseolus vulgaris]
MRETGEWVAANAEAEITSSSTFSFHQLQSHFYFNANNFNVILLFFCCRKRKLSVYGSMDASILDNIVPNSFGPIKLPFTNAFLHDLLL